MSVFIPNSSDIRIGIIKELLGIWESYWLRLTLSDAVVDRLIYENSLHKGVLLSPEDLARLFLGDKAETGDKSRLQELLFKAVKNSSLYWSVIPHGIAKISDLAKDQRVRHDIIHSLEVRFCNILIINRI
jgi:hypothetical protein